MAREDSATEPLRKQLVLGIPEQPDDFTCGPTCLHAIYEYFGDHVPLDRVISEVVHLETGGTLAVLLAIHALKRGYRTTIYSYNLQLFDPTWIGMSTAELGERLQRQMEAKDDPKLRLASASYQEYLSLGGKLRLDELSSGLVRRYLKRDLPILAGLSATYLYGCAREACVPQPRADDVRGSPVGHFVVLSGYDVGRREVRVADPLLSTPRFTSHHYWIGMQRVLAAILLGVLTYDGNLLIVEPVIPRKGAVDSTRRS